MTMWEILIIKALEPGRRAHTGVYHLVMAPDPESAVEKLKHYVQYRIPEIEFISEPRAMGDVMSTSYASFTPAELADRKGDTPIVKPKKEPKLSTRPLGETQASVLKSLAEHNGWGGKNGCGWYWNSFSDTTRILDSLLQRCLVDKSQDGRYTINDHGRALLPKKN